MTDLNGRVVLIMGSNSGLGSAVASSFAKAGARLAFAGLNRTALPADVGDPAVEAATASAIHDHVSEAASAIGKIMRRWGRIDVLCSVAAGWTEAPGPRVRPPLFWRHLQALNTSVIGRVSELAMTEMLGAGGGEIFSMAEGCGDADPARLQAYLGARASVARHFDEMASRPGAAKVSLHCLWPEDDARFGRRTPLTARSGGLSLPETVLQLAARQGGKPPGHVQLH